MKSKSILIVGAGVVGLCCAYYLSEAGYAVTVCDEGAEPDENCSYGNGGLIVPSHFIPLAAPGMVGYGLKMMRRGDSPFGIELKPNLAVIQWAFQFLKAANKERVTAASPVLRDLALASRSEYELLASTLGSGFGYAKRGLLMVCKEEKTLTEEAHVAEAAGKLGLVTEVLDEAGLTKKDPSVKMDAVGGVYFESDAHLTPAQFMKELKVRLTESGVRLMFGCRVTGFQKSDSTLDSADIRRSEGGSESVKVDSVLLAAGAWSAELGHGLGLKLPIVAGKGYGFTVKSAPETPEMGAILTEARIAVTPMLDGVRFVGTMEIGSPSMTINEKRLNGMHRLIPDFYPSFKGVDFKASPAWVGLRPLSPDGLPLVGRAGKYGNVFVATGHAMVGMSLGPITGRLISEIVAGQRPSVPVGLLNPDRF